MGIVVVGAALSWITLLILAFISSRREIGSSDLAELIELPSGLAVGFIPLFIYGAWLGQQIQALAVS